MSIIRINKTKDYTIMSNYHFKEKEMSLKAKGLLSEMLSLPENWNYSIAGLVAINKENEGAIKNILEELKKFNYLKVTKLLPNETKSGRIEYIYDIYENPKQEGKKQGVVFQGVEFQEVENRGQLNINNKIIKNKKFNNNINMNEIIDYLNLKTNKHFRYTASNIAKIRARIKEGFTEKDFKKVIDKKCLEWLNDEKMNTYLRPETLFGTKFESYLQQENHKLPQWIDKEYKEEIATDEEIEELNKLLGE